MNNKNSNYYLGKEYPGVYFTQREVDCLLCLFRGHTIVSAARSLSLSPRTVELYVKNMRLKMAVPTKSDLLKKLRKIGFLTQHHIMLGQGFAS